MWLIGTPGGGLITIRNISTLLEPAICPIFRDEKIVLLDKVPVHF